MRKPSREGLPAREEFEAPRAEPVPACLRLARRHQHDRTYRDRPVCGGPIERAVSTPVPAPAVRAHPGYPKTRVWEAVPPSQLFRIWPTVAHGLAHVARLDLNTVKQGRATFITAAALADYIALLEQEAKAA